MGGDANGFYCESCGRYHEGLPMDIEHPYPVEYMMVPVDERDQRVYYTPDFCIVDEKEYLIRGVLPIPITGRNEEFRWGVWALVEKEDLFRYIELGNLPEGHKEPPILGRLSGGVSGYADSDLLPVVLYLQSGSMRPVFRVLAEGHPLTLDQTRGVPIEYVHDLWHKMQKTQAIKSRNARG